jgi:uncharacterized protein YabN with tetrapyrrole methylase and pyrophosphatase domain
MSDTAAQFEKLVAVMRTLRSPDGCPWDREQTPSRPRCPCRRAHGHDAIERYDIPALKEETATTFSKAFSAQVPEADGSPSMTARAVAKFVRRHPHVFQKTAAHDGVQRARSVCRRGARSLNSLKAQNAPIRTALPTPERTKGPSPLRAYKIQRAPPASASTGDIHDVIAKIEEEVAELKSLDSDPKGLRAERKWAIVLRWRISRTLASNQAALEGELT